MSDCHCGCVTVSMAASGCDCVPVTATVDAPVAAHTSVFLMCSTIR